MLTGNCSTPSEGANCYAVGGPVSTEQPRTRPLALFSVASTRVYPLEHQTVREALRRKARRLPRTEQPRCPVRSPHRRDNRLKPRRSGVPFITRLTGYGPSSRRGPTKTPAATAGVQKASGCPNATKEQGKYPMALNRTRSCLRRQCSPFCGARRH